MGAEAHVHRYERRHRQRNDAPARRRRRRGRRELVLDALRRPRVDGEHVPIQGSTRRHAHCGHQVDLFGAEGVEAAVGDVLQRRSLVRGHLLAEGEHLAPVGMSGADRTVVAVGMGAGLGGGEAETARLEGLGQQGAHGGDLLVGGDLFAAGGTHHLAPKGAVADQEPGVNAELAVEGLEVFGEGRPVPWDALLEGGQRHALDLGHHPPDVVGVLGIDRRQGEPAVPSNHGRDAVDVGG